MKCVLKVCYDRSSAATSGRDLYRLFIRDDVPLADIKDFDVNEFAREICRLRAGDDAVPLSGRDIAWRILRYARQGGG